MKITKEKGVGVHSLIHSTLGVKGHARAPGWGLGRTTNMSIIYTNLHKPNNKLLMHGWSNFGAQMRHGHT